MFVPKQRLLLLALIAFGGAAGEARAFCRQKTCEDVVCGIGSDPDCVDVECVRDERDCIVEGDDLYYESACLTFGVEAGAAELVGLTNNEFDDVVQEAFQRWADLDCGDGDGPGLNVQSVGVVAANGNFFCAKLPELNVSVWRFTEPCVTDDPEEVCWRHTDLSLGYTTSTFAVETGEVFDADVELNVNRIQSSFPADVMRQVVLSIATHEAGHFLGIAHSDNDEAIMATSYSGTALLGRDFSQDDIDAICTAYPPDTAPKACSAPGVSDAALFQEACDTAAERPADAGCALGPVAQRPAAGYHGALLGLVALAFMRRRRSIRRVG